MFPLVQTPEGRLEPLVKIPEFDPDNPTVIVLKTGIYRLGVTIEDAWGAKINFIIPSEVVVRKYAHASEETHIVSLSLSLSSPCRFMTLSPRLSRICLIPGNLSS